MSICRIFTSSQIFRTGSHHSLLGKTVDSQMHPAFTDSIRTRPLSSRLVSTICLRSQWTSILTLGTLCLHQSAFSYATIGRNLPVLPRRTASSTRRMPLSSHLMQGSATSATGRYTRVTACKDMQSDKDIKRLFTFFHSRCWRRQLFDLLAFILVG